VRRGSRERADNRIDQIAVAERSFMVDPGPPVRIPVYHLIIQIPER